VLLELRSGGAERSLSLIPQVRRLCGREQQIAQIIYARGLVSANDIRQALGFAISNPAIRSMLGRLVRKGLITQVRCRQNRPFLYGPGLSEYSARENEVRQMAADFYGGSVEALANELAELFASSRSQLAA
jgi:predicted transcriptional regulator